MTSFILGEKEAQDQIDMFCDWYGIDLDEIEEVAESDALAMVRRALIKAFRKGWLEVRLVEDKHGGDSIEVLQRLHRPIRGRDGVEISEILYPEITGATKANVRIPKNASETAAMFHHLALISKEPVELFNKLRGSDIRTANLFGFLFLQV